MLRGLPEHRLCSAAARLALAKLESRSTTRGRCDNKRTGGVNKSHADRVRPAAIGLPAAARHKLDNDARAGNAHRRGLFFSRPQVRQVNGRRSCVSMPLFTLALLLERKRRGTKLEPFCNPPSRESRCQYRAARMAPPNYFVARREDEEKMEVNRWTTTWSLIWHSRRPFLPPVSLLASGLESNCRFEIAKILLET